MELGTAFALVAFSNQCIKYGRKLVKRCKIYRHAREEAKELLTAIELNWLKTDAQIAFVRSMANSLDERYLAIQCQILSELEGKLKTASLTLDQLIKSKEQGMVLMSTSKKIFFAFKKDSLEKIVEDLEKWQARFDPCWMLIMRMESRFVDDQLSRETQKPAAVQSQFILTAGGIRDAARANLIDEYSGGTTWLEISLSSVTKLPYSHVLQAWNLQSSCLVLLDQMRCMPSADVEQTTKDARELAYILQKVDSKTLGLLKCQGIIQEPEDAQGGCGASQTPPNFNLVFNIPDDMQNPRSLRYLLQEAAPHPLNERLDLAKQLANSVLYIHTARIIHKNIRPETIVVFENSKSVIGSPFLLGFQKFRPADGQTYMFGDEDWELNLYRHPSRQGIQPEDRYRMHHDIYSLGVVLLEIGLWSTFVDYAETCTGIAVPSNYLAALPAGVERDPRRRAFKNKQILENLAEQNLPRIIGQKYTDVVLLCLRCLDENDDVSLLSDYNDHRGEVDIGIKFVYSVLDRIHSISL